MSERQVCGQAPGDPAPSQYIRGWSSRLDIHRQMLSWYDKKKEVDIRSVGNLAVGSDH
jgi:hypothetical protein